LEIKPGNPQTRTWFGDFLLAMKNTTFAKRIMIQGTGSGVGKSVIVAALCRIFKQDGYKVAPFKAQNMALNSFVTRNGGEMGRAQVVQAEAAGIEPTVDMNPILIKPTSDVGAQIIVRGKVVGNMSAHYYHNHKPELIQVVSDSFFKLAKEYEIVVIEGAGSPAEVNLRKSDIVNMKMAEIADSPVLLVGDIDKGGVFAWLIGTLELLTEEERKRVKGLIINKFRGDINILKPGLDYLEERSGKDVLGVIPYFKDIWIEEEDSLSLEKARYSFIPEKSKISIEILYLPHISNFTDFDPLEEEEDVCLRYVGRGERIGDPDLLIIPGSKNTIDDLAYLKGTGYEEQILARVRKGTKILGICGGYQMLGKEIRDPYHIESSRGRIEGLGLIDAFTVLEKDKITSQVKAHLEKNKFFSSKGKIKGYEIHTGRTNLLKEVTPFFRITERFSRPVNIKDGAIGKEGRVFGTYIHGIFDDHIFRRDFLNYIRKTKGLPSYFPSRKVSIRERKEKEYDKLADIVRRSLDMKKIYKIMGL